MKLNNLQKRIFLNLWQTSTESRLIQNNAHLLGVYMHQVLNYLSMQKMMFWMTRARKLSSIMYAIAATPMKNGKGSAVNLFA